jgi:hypothetical protein
MALLYAHSNDLKGFINEYFIVIVRFCHDIVAFTRKSIVRQFASTMSDATIKAAQSELNSWASQIQDELRLLVAQKIDIDSEQNSRFQSITNKFSKSISHRLEIAARLRILDKCSIYDHETTWKQIRKLGNTNLYAQTDEYRNWRSETKSCSLLYLGILGCGKSVTMANIVDDLNLWVANQKASVVYFFVQQNIPRSSEARTIIGSIAKQLLGSRKDLADLPETRNNTPNAEDLLSMLERTNKPGQKTYIILDGLDLCELSARKEIFDFLRSLQEMSYVLVCVSYRQEPDLERDATFRKLYTLHTTSLPNNNQDIESYIGMELVHRIDNKSLNLGDASLIFEIHDALLAGSKGMFLWVALQIASLCTMQTDAEIRDALINLPDDLSQIYTRLLERQGHAIKYQRRILEFIAASQQPFTTEDLREALSVTPGDTTWTAANLINDVHTALASCGCLVVVEEETLTVQFVHSSVQDFLFQRYEGLEKTPMTFESCNRALADVIVTYISYGVFDTQISTFLTPRIETKDVPSKIIESVAASSKSAQSLALRFLARRQRVNFDVGIVFADHISDQGTNRQHEFIFVHYARQWCLEHICTVTSGSLGEHVTKLLPSLLDRNANGTSSGPSPGTAYMMAVTKNSESLLECLLGSSVHHFVNLPFPCQSPYGCYYDTATPMALAVCLGHERMIEILYPFTNSVLPRRDLSLSSSVCDAIYSRDTSRIRMLIGSNELIAASFANHICRSGRSVLACAIWGGHFDMVRYLIKEVRVNPTTGSPDHTPVKEALTMHDLIALDLVLSTCKELSIPQDRDELLLYAQEIGFEEAIPILEKLVEPLIRLAAPSLRDRELVLRAEEAKRNSQWYSVRSQQKPLDYIPPQKDNTARRCYRYSHSSTGASRSSKELPNRNTSPE